MGLKKSSHGLGLLTILKLTEPKIKVTMDLCCHNNIDSCSRISLSVVRKDLGRLCQETCNPLNHPQPLRAVWAFMFNKISRYSAWQTLPLWTHPAYNMGLSPHIQSCFQAFYSMLHTSNQRAGESHVLPKILKEGKERKKENGRGGKGGKNPNLKEQSIQQGKQENSREHVQKKA